jgi:hypothetical protein
MSELAKEIAAGLLVLLGLAGWIYFGLAVAVAVGG